MTKVLCVGFAMLAWANVAPAQTAGTTNRSIEPPQFGINTSARTIGDLVGFHSLETPTMRREKLQQALQLRREALLLQSADRGVLSPDHARYVRARSRQILSVGSSLPVRAPDLVASSRRRATD